MSLTFRESRLPPTSSRPSPRLKFLRIFNASPCLHFDFQSLSQDDTISINSRVLGMLLNQPRPWARQR
jgi:hypothetical protein